MRIFLLILGLICLTCPAWGQQLPTVLTEESFLRLVDEHHPLAVRAELQRDRAEAVLRSARGNFDPKVYGGMDQKYFQGTRYYSLIEGGVKVPTWFGIELNAAYERNEGFYLNPEQSVPETGLYAAGLTVSLGQGLLFDERRAELQRAQIYRRSTLAERQVLLNDLVYAAGAAYWEWAGAFAAVSIFDEAVAAATRRYVAVVSGAELGDRPAIDTLEARILLQNRELSRETALLDLANATARINAFLWLDGVVPVELETTTVPKPLPEVVVAPVLDSITSIDNPELTRMRLELETLDVDQRLQREYLKPTVDVKYNALLSGGADSPFDNLNSNNYKWGVTFAQPLLLRKERGKLQLTRIKMSETRLKLSDKIAGLAVKLATAENEANITASQYALASQIADDYAVLLAGERELFSAGESSLFLVNTREVSYIEARIKQVELLMKHRKARLARSYAAGRISLGIRVGVPSE